jgi:hypothetical protein
MSVSITISLEVAASTLLRGRVVYSNGANDFTGERYHEGLKFAEEYIITVRRVACRCNNRNTSKMSQEDTSGGGSRKAVWKPWLVAREGNREAPNARMIP